MIFLSGFSRKNSPIYFSLFLAQGYSNVPYSAGQRGPLVCPHLFHTGVNSQEVAGLSFVLGGVSWLSRREHAAI